MKKVLIGFAVLNLILPLFLLIHHDYPVKFKQFFFPSNSKSKVKYSFDKNAWYFERSDLF